MFPLKSDTTSSETPAETIPLQISASAQVYATKPDAVANAGTLQYGSSGEAVTLSSKKRLYELGYMFTTVKRVHLMMGLCRR